MKSEDAFAKVLKEKRLEARLTQETLAEKSKLSTRYISRLECGDQLPNYKYLLAVASGLGMKASELIKAVEKEEARRDAEKVRAILYADKKQD